MLAPLKEFNCLLHTVVCLFIGNVLTICICVQPCVLHEWGCVEGRRYRCNRSASSQILLLYLLHLIFDRTIIFVDHVYLLLWNFLYDVIYIYISRTCILFMIKKVRVHTAFSSMFFQLIMLQMLVSFY